jgi:hypothetical protein
MFLAGLACGLWEACGRALGVLWVSLRGPGGRGRWRGAEGEGEGRGRVGLGDRLGWRMARAARRGPWVPSRAARPPPSLFCSPSRALSRPALAMTPATTPARPPTGLPEGRETPRPRRRSPRPSARLLRVGKRPAARYARPRGSLRPPQPHARGEARGSRRHRTH